MKEELKIRACEPTALLAEALLGSGNGDDDGGSLSMKLTYLVSPVVVLSFSQVNITIC